jgi:MFS family permease
METHQSGVLTNVGYASEALDDGTIARMPRAMRSFAYPEFRLFWVSNLIIAMALMMQTVAQRWLVVELTDSALLVGAVSGLWGVTFALFSIPMGLVADRNNRRNLLLLATVVALAIALATGLLVAASLIQVWQVLVAGAITGVLMALRFPAGQAMTARLVPPKDLMNAISLNQTAHSLPSIAGTALGGVLVAAVGVAGAYFVTSGAFVIGILLLAGVAASFGAIQRSAPKSARADLGEAYEYLRSHAELVKLTGAMLAPFILGQSYILLLPLFVEEELHLGPGAFGVLSACLGAGSVLGALLVAAFGRERQLGHLMMVGILLTGVTAVGYGLSESVILTGAVLVAVGVSESALFASYQTLLMVRLPDELRGRVMGLMLTLVALFPVGAVAAGAAAEIVGMRTVAIAEGVIILPVAVLAWYGVLRGISREADVRVSPTTFEPITHALPD